jgi:hypothetical protein
MKIPPEMKGEAKGKPEPEPKTEPQPPATAKILFLDGTHLRIPVTGYQRQPMDYVFELYSGGQQIVPSGAVRSIQIGK